MLKLARTYDELNKYPKKKRFCVTGNLILVIAQSKIIQNRKRLKRLKFAEKYYNSIDGEYFLAGLVSLL